MSRQGASSYICCRWWGVRLTLQCSQFQAWLSHIAHAKDRASSSVLKPSGRLTCIHATRGSSTVLPRWGVVPLFDMLQPAVNGVKLQIKSNYCLRERSTQIRIKNQHSKYCKWNRKGPGVVRNLGQINLASFLIIITSSPSPSTSWAPSWTLLFCSPFGKILNFV